MVHILPFTLALYQFNGRRSFDMSYFHRRGNDEAGARPYLFSNPKIAVESVIQETFRAGGKNI